MKHPGVMENEALSPDMVGGEGLGEGALFDNRTDMQVRGVSPSVFALSPASGGERNGMCRLLRARQRYWMGGA